MTPRFIQLLGNTGLLALAVALLAVPIGTMLALLAVRTDCIGRRWWALAMVGLALVPMHLQGAAWQAGFGIEGWATNGFTGSVWLSGWRGAIWVHALAAVPWVLLIVGARLATQSPLAEEAALFSAPALRVLCAVTLRRAAPAVFVATLWVMTTVAAEIAVTDLFQIRTAAEEVYTSAQLGGDAWSITDGALTSGLLTTVVMWAALVAGLDWLTIPGAPRQDRARLLPLRFWAWPCGVGASVIVAWAVAVPLGSLIWKLGVVVEQTAEGRVRCWSAAKAVTVLANSVPRFHFEAGWTWLISTLAATLAFLLAAPLAWPARLPGRARRVFKIVVALGFALPGPVIGLAVIALLNHEATAWWYDRTVAAPVVALTVRAWPWTAVVLWLVMTTVPRESLEQALLEGATTVQLWRQLVWPARRGGIAAAWLVGWLIASGDLAASILVLPPGVTTLPVQLFGLIHFGVEDQVAAGCLLSVATVVAGSCLVGHWLRVTTR